MRTPETRNSRLHDGSTKLLRSRIWTFLAVASLSGAVLVGTQLVTDFEKLYSSDVIFRWQTDRLLSGDIAIGNSPENLSWDMAWGRGTVQQVWGLMIPCWRLPFEAAAKIFGRSGFPDRLAFGVAFAAVAYVVIRFHVLFFRRFAGRSNGALSVAILGLFPTILAVPFLTLCGSRLLVYEEVAAYAYLAGILLMVWTAWVAIRPRAINVLMLAFMSGIILSLRPTFGAYGIASILVACLAVWRRKRDLRLVLVTLATFGCAVGLVLYTNWVRFGGCFEFGYSLNTNSDSPMAFASRFDNPYRHEPVLSASRELFSLLFLTKPRAVDSLYDSELFPGQSHTFRWREIYLPTFDLSTLIMATAAWIWLISRAWLRFRTRRKGRLTLLEAIGIWSVAAAAPLAFFYLRFPFISSRYLLDFAPSFAAATWIFFWLALRIGRRISWVKWPVTYLPVVLLAWWGYEVTTLGRALPPLDSERAFAWNEIPHRMMVRFPHPSHGPLPNCYTNGFPFEQLGIPFNGTGWSSPSATEACVSLYVADPDSLILDVVPAGTQPLALSDFDCIQAKVGLEFLARESISQIPNGVRILFHGPKASRYRTGIQLVSLGMTSVAELKDGPSKFRLLKVSWHRDQASEARSSRRKSAP